MSGADLSLYEPVYYNISWTIIGIVFLLLALATIGLIFYVTRKKKVKSLSTLRVEQPKLLDLEALKQKYIGLIDQAERNYLDHRIKASVAHQHLSLIVRLFYGEALGFRADIMTLDDLKKSTYTQLIKTIEKLYPDEFDTLEKGSVKDAAANARKLVEDL